MSFEKTEGLVVEFVSSIAVPAPGCCGSTKVCGAML